MVLFNRHFTGEATSITVDWARLGWPQEQQVGCGLGGAVRLCSGLTCAWQQQQ